MNRPGTILIVDDSPVILTVLTESLETAGFTVKTADTGDAALASVAALHPDLILMDILMPAMDGFEICRRLNAREETRYIPVIFLTSVDDVKNKVEGFRLGAVDYVTKPFQTEELVSRVQTHLEVGRLTRQLNEKTAELAKANDKLLAGEKRFKNVISRQEAVLSDKLLMLFMRNSPIYAFIKEISTTESRVLLASDNYEQMVGIPGAALVGKSMEEMFPAEFAAKITADDQAVVARGEVLHCEEMLGGRFYTTIKFPFALKGKMLLAGYTIDITEQKMVEKELLASEDRFRTVADFTYAWEYWIAPDLQFLYCSPACERISGYRAEEFLHDPTLLITITHPEDREMVRLHEKGASAPSPEQTDLEFRIVKRNGEVRWISHVCSSVLGNKGEYKGRRASNRDITDHKQLADTRDFLAQASFSNGTNTFFEELAQFLARTLDMDFICIDRLEGDNLNATTLAVWHDGEFEDNVTYALKDTPCGNVVGKSICCFPERVCELFPEDQALRELQAECYIGVTLWGHDGKPVGLIAAIGHKPLKDRTQAGNILQIVAGRAASELERIDAEMLLRKSEEKFRHLSLESQALLNAIPDSLMLVDRELKVRWGNKAAAETFGLTPALLANQTCYSLWPGRTTPCDNCPVKKSFASGEPQGTILTEADGRIWDVRTIPLVDATGEVTSVIEVNRDITEHRQLEEQLRQSQKMESIGTLAGGIAHDFNNILTTISGYGQITLERMSPYDPQRYNIDCILESSERAVNLIQDLLMFSRKHDSEKRSINLNAVINRFKRFLNKVIGEDIHFQTKTSNSSLPVLADEHQLEQVLMNLVTNASHAMPRGGKITLTTEIFDMDSDFIGFHGYGQPGRYALLTVKDSGLGMDSATQQRVFEPFFSTKEVGKGTGLGLAVVYGIIKQHNGYIDIYSTPGKGTTFTVYLPLSADSRKSEERCEQKGTVTGGTETILLAEDDEMVRNLTRRVLTEAGYTVITAVDGNDAQVKFAENRTAIDLLLFDLIMPKINGKEAFDEIHRIQPAVKVIFSSGYAPDTIKHKISLDEGIYLIAKPVSPRVLLQKVREVLDGEGAGQ